MRVSRRGAHWIVAAIRYQKSRNSVLGLPRLPCVVDTFRIREDHPQKADLELVPYVKPTKLKLCEI